MEHVTGIGGIFFKTHDKNNLQTWYEKNLGVPVDQDGYVVFQWRDKQEPKRIGRTVWSLFAQDSSYFNPSTSEFMINFRVRNLARMLEQLRAAGAQVDDKIEESEYGKFGWVMDPEGRRIELWEPPHSELEEEA